MPHVCYYNNSDATIRLLMYANPEPVSASTVGKINCLVINARTLKSYHKDSSANWQSVCNLHRFQDLVYADASMRHGSTKISATLKSCILALQYLGEIGLIEAVVEFLSQSKQPPSKLSKNLNLNWKPSSNSLRSFLPKLLRLLVEEFYSVFAMGYPMKTQVGQSRTQSLQAFWSAGQRREDSGDIEKIQFF